MRDLIAKRNVDVAGGLHHFAMRWDKSQAIHRIGDWNVSHLIILVADHGPEVTFVCQLHGFDSEACSKNAIKCRRCTAALQMSEHAGARFFASALGDLSRYDIAHAAKTEFAVFTRTHYLLTVFGSRAFRNDHERAEIARRITFLDRGRNFIVIKRDLWN